MAKEGKWVLACVGTVIVALLTVTAAAAGASPWKVLNHRRVALFGDSLAYEASGEFTFLAHAQGYAAEAHAYGGTAPCDWFGDLAAMVARPPSQRPSVAVLEFSGDAFTPCMEPTGVMRSDDGIVSTYDRDAMTFVTTLLAAGIRPVFALAPAVDHPSLVPRINELWRSIAARYAGSGVTVVDAGAPVEEPDGSFARTLPCGSWESPASGCFDGLVVVRAADGTHFCPTVTETMAGVVGVCPVPSPGALRYAFGLLEALEPPGSAA